MQVLTLAIVFITLLPCEQQNTKMKRAVDADYRQTMLVRADSIRISLPNAAQEVFNRMNVIDWIRNQNFDIAVTSGVTCFQPLLRMAGIPRSVIVTSSEPLPWLITTMGMPISENPIIKKMSYVQRAKNVISSTIADAILQHKLFDPLDELGKRIVGNRYTPLKDAVGQTSFLLVNNEKSLDFPRPITSQWTELIFADVFSETPDTTFIWQSDQLVSSNQSNVVSVQDVPEIDLLADPRVSAVITDGHGNLLHDAISSGKPVRYVVCIPSDQEQLRNCHQLEKKGAALVKACWEVKPRHIKDMMKQALKTETHSSARLVSEAIASEPIKAQERLARTIESPHCLDYANFVG
ncbi:unnamed protein product [Strongylus vulgaris]|uniref:glucuronosyltransferase n=1 Tax=Strongylus vulgaris TaxID=40348 RepID=A0A3P7J1T2_STRVU|nr:unnamed protein product [Strongylus vulgaris]